MSFPDHARPPLADAPERVVFGPLTPEREAARVALAAHLITHRRVGEISRYRYAESLGLATDGPRAAYTHRFACAGRTDIAVTTRHDPDVDDLGGLTPPRSGPFREPEISPEEEARLQALYDRLSEAPSRTDAPGAPS